MGNWHIRKHLTETGEVKEGSRYERRREIGRIGDASKSVCSRTEEGCGRRG